MEKGMFLLGILATLLLFQCTSERRSGISTGESVEASSQTRESSGNLIFTAGKWSAAVDPFGSKYHYTEPMIKDGVAKVNFTIAQKTEADQWYPFVELICDVGKSFTGYSGVLITYQCGSDLLVKLSQSDFGEQGNETYSHYQYRLPATEKWKTTKVDFSLFEQPAWTPEISRDIPLTTENINAVYLVPDLDVAIGESATLKVSHLELY